MTIPAFRFAPSPNGELHLGHALSAFLNADMADAAGGRLLLRIEDIDLERCRPEYEAAIRRDLEWLGIAWEQPVRRQSEHFEAYRHALRRLKRQGLLYPAFMTRAEVRAAVAARESRGLAWPRDPDGAPHYPGDDRRLAERERRRRLSEGLPYAWRLDMAAALAAQAPLPFVETGEGPEGQTGEVVADPGSWGDVVVARMDIPTSYHLSVTVDDALQGITHVVRGRDLFHATGVHRLLQRLLDLPTPLYHHHRLIMGADGRKLSKSARDTGLAVLREAGATSDDIRSLVGLPPRTGRRAAADTRA